MGQPRDGGRELPRPITAALASLPAPGLRLALAARTYRWTRKVVSRVPERWPRPREDQLYSPAVAQAEREGRLAHGPVAASGWVDDEAAAALAHLRAIEAEAGVAATDAYADALGEGPSGQPLVRFPVLVPPGMDAEASSAACAPRASTRSAGTAPRSSPASRTRPTYNYVPGDVPMP